MTREGPDALASLRRTCTAICLDCTTHLLDLIRSDLFTPTSLILPIVLFCIFTLRGAYLSSSGRNYYSHTTTGVSIYYVLWLSIESKPGSVSSSWSVLNLDLLMVGAGCFGIS